MINKKEEYFIVEVNEGIYLQERLKGYTFVTNIRSASIFSSPREANVIAAECGGKVKRYLVTHEILEVE